MGSSSFQMPAPDYTPITKMYEQQAQLQREAAAKADAAQKKAMVDAQDNAAQQAQTQANYAAQQALGRQAAAQEAKDAAAKETMNKSMAGMGSAIAGSGYDPAKMEEALKVAQPFALPAVADLIARQNEPQKERKLLNQLTA
jgi:hypothetical protein